MKYDSLGDRMKSYEDCWRFRLPERLPLVIRVDGRAFHTYTANMDRPFDFIMTNAMQHTAVKLCGQISNAVFAYGQSDEISILVRTFERDTQPWFDNNLQKLVSLAASMATSAFTLEHYCRTLRECTPPIFDARCFILPEHEVINYFIWRQQDSVRNSIQSVGHANFSQKQMQGLKCPQIQEKLFQERGINWNDTPTHNKRGWCVYKVQGEFRPQWKLDCEIPEFTQDREFIERVSTPMIENPPAE